MNFDNLSKNKKLILCIVFDAIGFIPFIDIVWAPMSAYLISKMFKGYKGKIAGVISFIEEFLPGLDVIPTFTIMWLLTYAFSSKETVIEIS